MDIPYHILTGEDAARLIIAWPSSYAFPPKSALSPGKREIRIKHSKRFKPSCLDLKTWIKADHQHHWAWYRDTELQAFPRIGVRLGPLLKSGQFDSPEVVHNPLLSDRPRVDDRPFEMYSRARFEAETKCIEHARALLRENFLLGQRDEGPYLDGLLFMRADNLLLAEIQHLRNRLRATSAALSGKRGAKAEVKDTWRKVGADEAVAMKFKQTGYTVRKIECAKPYYEVKM